MLNYPLLEFFNIDKPRCPFCYKEERTVIVQKERLMLMLLVLCCMCALTSNEVKWREFMLGVSVSGDQRSEVDVQYSGNCVWVSGMMVYSLILIFTL